MLRKRIHRRKLTDCTIRLRFRCGLFAAPPDSMWSDGSAELSTNFAFNSGLDGGHCCIKVDIVHQPRLNSSSVWKGENCATYLHGICEYQVTGNIKIATNQFFLKPKALFDPSIPSRIQNVMSYE